MSLPFKSLEHLLWGYWLSFLAPDFNGLVLTFLMFHIKYVFSRFPEDTIYYIKIISFSPWLPKALLLILLWMNVEFYWMIFLHVLKRIICLVLYLVNVLIISIGFLMVNHIFIAEIKHTWSWQTLLLICTRFNLPIFYLGFLHLCFYIILAYNIIFCGVLVWFQYQGYACLWNEIGTFPSSLFSKVVYMKWKFCVPWSYGRTSLGRSLSPGVFWE